ncbi:MAG: TetR/AcrR family transcriptional regulator [Deltaproteobacteria bacterium]|nr:MAG: TetR/AcrR family transcriptional regulator [Deltaproteobacteria bacterium]
MVARTDPSVLSVTQASRQQVKRDRILAAATAVFAERDFHQVHVSEVASRAGVGKGTVYLYFPTKDDLHRGALEASLERLAAEVELAAEAAAPPDTVLEEIVLVQRYEQRYERAARERRQRVRQAIERVLVRHRLARGAMRGLAAAFLLGLARAAILEHRAEDRPELYADRVVRLYLQGLERAQEPAARRRRAAG